MSERDRLAALLWQMRPDLGEMTTEVMADRLIAAGVTFLDSIPPDMTDYMAGYRQGQSDIDVERVRAEARNTEYQRMRTAAVPLIDIVEWLQEHYPDTDVTRQALDVLAALDLLTREQIDAGDFA